jgi:hypothetical protein
MSGCDDNTAEQRARLRRTPVRSKEDAVVHVFANELSDYGFAVALDDKKLAEFHSGRLMTMFRNAVRER